MGKKVESYESEDGKLFRTEREMILHEIDLAVRKEFPALKIGLGQIALNADRLLEILLPLAALQEKNHPETQPENHPEPVRSIATACRSDGKVFPLPCPPVSFDPSPAPRWDACRPTMLEDYASDG